MKIECKNIRKGGTKVELGNIEYHFEPLEDGAHVADVQIEAHIDTFLSIADAYKVYHGKLEPKETQAAINIVDPVPVISASTYSHSSGLTGSTVHDASYQIGLNTYSIEEIVAKAHDASGLSVEAWNELEAEDRHAKIDIILDNLAEAAENDDIERDALSEKYKAKFGKAPPANAKLDTIKAKLAE